VSALLISISKDFATMGMFGEVRPGNSRKRWIALPASTTFLQSHRRERIVILNPQAIMRERLASLRHKHCPAAKENDLWNSEVQSVLRLRSE